MLTADIIVLVAFVVFALLGVIVGFGRGLKFFTSGIFGIIISIFVCHLIFWLVLDISFVENLCNKFLAWLYDSGSVGSFFADIHVDYAVLAVVLFILIQIVRIIIVKTVKGVFESDKVVLRVLNKTFGAVLFVLVLFAIVLVVFQIVAWIGGTTAENFSAELDGSWFLLDALYEKNPLRSVFS